SAFARQQFRKDGSAYYQATVIVCPIQSFLSNKIKCVPFVPKSDQNICVNCGDHQTSGSSGSNPLISLMYLLIASRPDPMPGFPMPRYLANGLSFLSGRTNIFSCSSVSNTIVSPGFTPSSLRTFIGIVTCPLLVILALEFMLDTSFLTLSRFALLF